MAENQKGDQIDEEEKHSLQLRGFTIEQIQDIQHIAQEMATKQFQRAVTITNNFLITLVAVISSAFGLTTALAWNRAMTEWLPTVKVFDTNDPLVRYFSYAGFMTLLTIIVVGALVLLTSRIKGENMMNR